MRKSVPEKALKIVKRSGRLHGSRVAWKRSPNFDDRPDKNDISLLVIHNISLPPGEFGGCFVDDLFQNQLECHAHPYFKRLEGLKVSSHLLIDRSGKVTQYVPFHKRAWHAGESSYQGRKTCNDYSIGIELEGTDHEPFTTAQYRQLVAVIEALLALYPSLSTQRIVGHSDIAPGRKTDPGEHFDWSRLQKALDCQKNA